MPRRSQEWTQASPETSFTKPKPICYCFRPIRIQNLRFNPIRAFVLFLINGSGDPLSLPWPDNPDILILFDAEARNITCRRHVSLLQMFRNVIQFINSVETTSNFDWTFFILKVIKIRLSPYSK